MITKISGGKVVLEDRIGEDLNVYYQDGVILEVTGAALPHDRDGMCPPALSTSSPTAEAAPIFWTRLRRPF